MTWAPGGATPFHPLSSRCDSPVRRVVPGGPPHRTAVRKTQGSQVFLTRSFCSLYRGHTQDTRRTLTGHMQATCRTHPGHT